MTTFDTPLRGDALAAYMPKISAGDTVTVEVTIYGHVSTIISQCWEEYGSLHFLLDDLLRYTNGSPAQFVTALLAHEPVVVLPTGLHAVVRLTEKPGIGGETDPQWTAARRPGQLPLPWRVHRDGLLYTYATDDEIAAVYAETLYEGLAVES